MNKKALEKSVGHRVRLRPIARRFDGDVELPQLDDDWIIQRVSKEGANLLNTRTGHCPTLGTDHIYSYSTDPDRSRGNELHGMLRLLVQLVLKGNEVLTEPTPRPGEPNQSPLIFAE
jgi:hypothetical protein